VKGALLPKKNKKNKKKTKNFGEAKVKTRKGHFETKEGLSRKPEKGDSSIGQDWNIRT